MKTERVECIKTEGYTFSLVLNAIYEKLPDAAAAEHKMIRVIDESGENYLYPASYFVPAEVTAKPPNRAFSRLA